MSKIKPGESTQYNIFLLYDGYVEDGALSPVVMSMGDIELPDADDWKRAWEVSFASLREAYLQVLKEANGMQGGPDLRPSCCLRAISAGSAFCPDCGVPTRKSKKYEFPQDDDEREDLSASLLGDLRVGTNSSYDYEWVQVAERHGWEIPGHIDIEGPGVITVVHNHAASLLVNYENLKKTPWWDSEFEFWSEDLVTLHPFDLFHV